MNWFDRLWTRSNPRSSRHHQAVGRPLHYPGKRRAARQFPKGFQVRGGLDSGLRRNDGTFRTGLRDRGRGVSATQHPVLTIGHSNHSLEKFVELLETHAIDEVATFDRRRTAAIHRISAMESCPKRWTAWESAMRSWAESSAAGQATGRATTVMGASDTTGWPQPTSSTTASARSFTAPMSVASS